MLHFELLRIIPINTQIHHNISLLQSLTICHFRLLSLIVSQNDGNTTEISLELYLINPTSTTEMREPRKSAGSRVEFTRNIER